PKCRARAAPAADCRCGSPRRWSPPRAEKRPARRRGRPCRRRRRKGQSTDREASHLRSSRGQARRRSCLRSRREGPWRHKLIPVAFQLSTQPLDASLGVLSIHLDGKPCRVGCEFCYLGARTGPGGDELDLGLIADALARLSYDEVAVAISEPV